jgi:hypothetical protein
MRNHTMRMSSAELFRLSRGTCTPEARPRRLAAASRIQAKKSAGASHEPDDESGLSTLVSSPQPRHLTGRKWPDAIVNASTHVLRGVMVI